jgi:hypothetical protein
VKSKNKRAWVLTAIAVMLSGPVLSVPTMAVAADKKAEEPSVRPEMGEALKAAQEALAAKQFKVALAKIGEAEAAAANPTPYERYILDRMRGSAAVGAGDTATALKAFNAVVESPHLPTAEKVPTLDALVRLSFSSRNFPATIEALQKYRAAGGNKPETLEILPQALYLAQRYREAAAELTNQIRATEAAGKTPSKQSIELLASCSLKQNELPGYLAALRSMVSYYPDKRYWLDLIVRTGNQTGFSDRLTLDIYRLREYTGTLEQTSDYMEAIQLSLQAGFPGEADRMYKEGEKAGKLGKGTGQDADRQRRLKDLVARKVAEDKKLLAEGERQAAQAANGDGLIATGFNLVMYGDYNKGLELMRQGMAKGGLTRPEEAKLRQGYAYVLAGQADEANKVLSQVRGKDGTADLAALWRIALKKR